MKRFLILLVGISTLFLCGCKRDAGSSFDSSNIRFENGKEFTIATSEYTRTSGTSGIIGTFGYSNGSSIKSWSFNENGTFEYIYLSQTKKHNYKGTYVLTIDDEGYFVVAVTYNNAGTTKYRYFIKDDILNLWEQ